MNAAESLLNQQITENKTPGIQYYFFNTDSLIYKYLGGFADIKNQKKVTNENTFNANSVTKTFTALAIVQLAEQGKLKLNDKVSKYIKDFPYPNSITIRQLLTHSSGIPNPIPLKWVHNSKEHSSFNYREYFNVILEKKNKVKNKPNEKLAYSNLGYVLLGVLIEEVSRQNYTDYINKNIIQKIGIKQSQLDFTVPNAKNHSKGYQKKFSFMNFLLGFLFDKSKYMDQTEGKWISGKTVYVNGPSYGGLMGTGGAFVTYIQELLKPDNKLISEDSKKLLFEENILNNGKNTNMCLSWFKGELNGHTYYAHAGGGAFYYCEIRLYPELGKGSVVMFNRTGMSDARFLDKVDKHFLIKN